MCGKYKSIIGFGGSKENVKYSNIDKLQHILSSTLQGLNTQLSLIHI